ncbi:MAG: sigma-70 family RNA polymerase sigma factor [Bacteroidota bacterium]
MKVPLNNNYCTNWENFISHGDREALSLIYFDHYDLLFNFGLKHTSDTQIIEDSIQNTFSYFLKVRKKLGLVSNVAGYLFISFRRQLFLDLKIQKKLLHNEKLSEKHFAYFNNPEQDQSDLEEENQLRMVVKECIGKLSAKQQELIYLKYECDLTYEDISALLDITVESCHKSMYRSIKAIRTEAQKIRHAEKRLIFFVLTGRR